MAHNSMDSAACTTRWVVSGLTGSRPFRTPSTVEALTPVARDQSAIVGLFPMTLRAFCQVPPERSW